MATLSVKITGDASDFQKAVSAAEKTLSNFDKKVGSIGKAVSNIGSKLSKYITTPAMSATSALVGVTLVKGFDRLKGIDEARAKLKGLGHDAESIEEIMNSALTSVKGTAYGLDEAATTAASAVAAGIKPGKELTRYLSLTADAAAIAGSSMSEMGSIFNKVQTSQVAYTEELEMLADRGVPIYAWIAEEAGVAQGAVKELASDGQISSELFLNAVEKNIGGAAKIMGESSFTAAVANINASLSRIGANFLDAGEQGGGFFSQVKPLLAELNDDLGTLEDKAADLGVNFGKAFTQVVNKAREIKAEFEALPPAVQKAIGAGTVFAVGLGPSLQVVGQSMETISTVSGGVGKAFTSIKSTVSGLPSTFKTLGKGIGNVVGDFKNLGSGLLQPFTSLAKAPLFEPVTSKITSFFSGLKSFPGNLKSAIITPISNGFNTLIGNIGMKFPALAGIIGAFETNTKGMFGKIGGSLSSLLGKVGSFASTFGPTFAKGMSIAAGVSILVAGLGFLRQNFDTQINDLLAQATEKGPQLITDFCNGIVSAIPNLLTQGTTLIRQLLETITALLPSFITGGMEIICALVNGLALNLPQLIPAALDMIITLVTGLIENLPQLVDSGIQLLSGIVKGIVNSLPKLVSAIPKIISSIVITIGQNLPTILQTGIELLIMLINGILQAIPDLIASLPEVISTIQDAFAETNWLQVGKDLLNSIIDGIKSVLSNLWSTIKDIANGIAEMLGFNVSGKAETSGSSVPHNAGGTNNFEGGLTYVNEGGRGELISLPSGAQIIPHDISVEYAKEAARSNSVNGSLDLSDLGDYIVAAVVDTSRMYAQEIGKGISNMRMTVNNREAGRFISGLGFSRG